MPNLTIAFCVLLSPPPSSLLHPCPPSSTLPSLLFSCLPASTLCSPAHLFSHRLLLTHPIGYASLAPCDDFVLYQSVTCVLAQPLLPPCIHHVDPCAAAASTGRKAVWPRPCQPTERSTRLWWELLILQPPTQATQMSSCIQYTAKDCLFSSLCGYQPCSTVPDLCASHQLHLPVKALLRGWNCRQMCSHLGIWLLFSIVIRLAIVAEPLLGSVIICIRKSTLCHSIDKRSDQIIERWIHAN